MSDYNVREERSNAGASALAQAVLTNVFGLTSELTSRLMDTIQTNGEMPALRQSIKLLPVSAHSRLNQIIGAGETSGVEDTPFDGDDLEDDQSQEMGDNNEFDSGSDSTVDGDTSNMDGNIDLDSGGDIGDDIDNAYDPNGPSVGEDDFDEDSRKDSFKESRGSFASFRENAMLNAKVDNAISSNMDSNLDAATLKKVKGLEMKGQKDAAQNIRKQAARKDQAAGGVMRPTQRKVLAKKKELARAIQADKQAAAKEDGTDEPI